LPEITTADGPLTQTLQPVPTTGVESVVLLDELGQPCGTAPKSEVHTTDTPLHLAFSLYVFDGDGRFLATRRALTKVAWAGVWTNSCCGHPGPGEDLLTAASRRLEQELGLRASSITAVLPDYRYRAVSPEGLVEHEICPVFVARVDALPVPNPAEVVEHAWVAWPDFVAVARTSPWLLSPWSAEQALLVDAAMTEQDFRT
jgi:isopentenyl-diphosphate Delta-isomerase